MSGIVWTRVSPALTIISHGQDNPFLLTLPIHIQTLHCQELCWNLWLTSTRTPRRWHLITSSTGKLKELIKLSESCKWCRENWPPSPPSVAAACPCAPRGVGTWPVGPPCSPSTPVGLGRWERGGVARLSMPAVAAPTHRTAPRVLRTSLLNLAPATRQTTLQLSKAFYQNKTNSIH